MAPQTPGTPETYVGEAEDVASRLVREVEAAAAEALAARGRFALALPGGSVARLLLPRLAQAGLAVGGWHVFFTDERCVPANDPESNVGLARRLWLDPAGFSPAQVHPLPGEAADPLAASAAYEAAMLRILEPSPRLDFVLLGVGEDGHVASLFPGHEALEERERLVVFVEGAPKPPPRRLSLTLRALIRARRVAIVALGATKAHAVGSALHDAASGLPVALVARGAARCAFYLDAESAALPAR